MIGNYEEVSMRHLACRVPQGQRPTHLLVLLHDQWQHPDYYLKAGEVLQKKLPKTDILIPHAPYQRWTQACDRYPLGHYQYVWLPDQEQKSLSLLEDFVAYHLKERELEQNKLSVLGIGEEGTLMASRLVASYACCHAGLMMQENKTDITYISLDRQAGSMIFDYFEKSVDIVRTSLFSSPNIF